MAKRKKFGSKQNKEVAAETRLAEEDLDRFAGSSDEENEDDKGTHGLNDDAIDVGQDDMCSNKDNVDDADDRGRDNRLLEDQETASSSSEGEEEDADHADADDSDEEEDNELRASRTAGMANAMARILGAPTRASGTQSIVLSKTTTPLQKLASEELRQARELREKRRLNRDKHLQALHVPLSVATTAHMQRNNSSQVISRELEEERAFRRIATRGVVALFNAISQHQKRPNDAQVENADEGESNGGKSKKMTKHGFLDMIKSKASADTSGTKVSGQAFHNSNTQQENGKQWKALKDDFMLNPKQNWDQESSDEGDWEEETEIDGKRSPKRLRGS